MKRTLLKGITIWDETHPLHGTKSDILVEDGFITEIIASGEKQWDADIPVVLENAHISGGWHDRALFITNSDLSALTKYSQETGFKKISLIHFPELIADAYYQEISAPAVEHFIPLFSQGGQPVDIKGLDRSSGWVLFLDDPVDSLANLLEELRNVGKPLMILPFERKNPDPYSVAYSTENLWKGINAIRPELLQAKLNALIQLLTGLDIIVLSPLRASQTPNLIPLLSLIPSYDPDGFPTKQLPPYSPQLLEQLKDSSNSGLSFIGVASCNWLNAKPQNFPWDIRSPKVFDVPRTKKAISLLFSHLPYQIIVHLLTASSLNKSMTLNTMFSSLHNDLQIHNP
ncbi:MAG: hypothetical protein GXO48_00995 [Chlorobi bacterium]|nr:hypothetical protein [Chlorobiota bacterium]